ncbi:hypothetical protein KIN20_018208 [Parelaphostrongylus tenuis]|uniref:Uncharacterized protein n=1 Tax=Parelaphostrongylus tenuis TaxID=148309 RepID=A0AAD5N3Z9_PARTN|nr:hypothetical protein KIN20_018208 [Parelaphostrongylus tenuis]
MVWRFKIDFEPNEAIQAANERTFCNSDIVQEQYNCIFSFHQLHNDLYKGAAGQWTRKSLLTRSGQCAAKDDLTILKYRSGHCLRQIQGPHSKNH